MKSVILLAHPNPMSFNAAIAKVAQEELEKKGEVKFKNLYEMNFNPVLTREDFEGYHTGKTTADIKQEQDHIAWADLLVMVAPVWWFSVPAILKGYVDRVFSIGFAYEYTSTGPRGLLTGKKALVITTSGADEKSATLGGMVEGIRKTFVEGVFGFSGFARYEYHNLFAVPTVSKEEHKQMLTEIRDLVSKA